jgi:hypothetical protein
MFKVHTQKINSSKVMSIQACRKAVDHRFRLQKRRKENTKRNVPNEEKA